MHKKEEPSILARLTGASSPTVPDSATFRLHYRATVLLLLLLGMLVGAKQFFGTPISCEVDRGKNNDVMEAYCWEEGIFVYKEKEGAETDALETRGE